MDADGSGHAQRPWQVTGPGDVSALRTRQVWSRGRRLSVLRDDCLSPSSGPAAARGPRCSWKLVLHFAILKHTKRIGRSTSYCAVLHSLDNFPRPFQVPTTFQHRSMTPKHITYTVHAQHVAAHSMIDRTADANVSMLLYVAFSSRSRNHEPTVAGTRETAPDFNHRSRSKRVLGIKATNLETSREWRQEMPFSQPQQSPPKLLCGYSPTLRDAQPDGFQVNRQ